MRLHIPLALFLFSGLATLSSCATKGDLDHLKQELQGDVKSAKEDLGKDLETLEANVGKLSKSMTTMQAELDEALSQFKSLAKESAQNRTQLRSTRRAMANLLQAQETAYREGLKSVQAASKDLGESQEDHQP